MTFVGKVMSLLFNMLSKLVIDFLPRNKRLLISLQQSPSAVILEPKKIKSATVSTLSPSICHEVIGLDARIYVFWTLSFKSAFSLSFFTVIKRLFSSSWLSAIKWKWKSLSRVGLFVTPWTIQSMDFSRSEVGSLSLLQRIFPAQGSNPGLPHCRQILYHLSYQGSPNFPIQRVFKEKKLLFKVWIILT